MCQIRRYDLEAILGETLHQLHIFCNIKPSSNAIYITNQLLVSAGNVEKSFNEQNIKAITSAVMSKMCHTSEKSCSVCGTELYPLPFFHFTGNMFSSILLYLKIV